MYHLRRIKVLLATCMLACASLWAQDTKIAISSATANSYHQDYGASNAVDGVMDNHWHSGNKGSNYSTTFPVTFTITLNQAAHVDYVRYYPRTDSSNGHWDAVTVSYCSTTTGSSFTTLGSYTLNGEGSVFDFPIGKTCGQVKFTINSGRGGWATASEIEAYAYNTEKVEAFAPYFTDNLYTELKQGVTSSDGIADADVKALVEAMLADAADYKKFRVGEYEAYETIGTLQQRLKTKNPYNKFENPTGIYLNAGEPCIVAVSGIGDYPVGLKIKNWYTNENSSSYILRNGLNYITATSEGNVFVNYYTDNYATAPNVKVHFINAPVLGYWDAETMNNADWVKLLQGKADDDHRIIITRSKHAQLAYPISAWKTHCPTDIKTTMTYYQQVQWALRDMMRLEYYGLQTKNRQLYYATNYGFMAAGEEGAYCDYESLGAIMKPDNKSFDFWGVGHEWGHNNQIYPGFHWSGCGETTNNIYASWAQYHFTGNRDANGHPTYLRLEDEKTGIDEYSDMRGGRMQTYFEEALRKGVAWQLQDGPDYHNATPNTITVTGRDADGNDLGEVTTTSRNYDHFVKLAPFWQLNLWGTLANKCPYIIPDVIHAIRTSENYDATYNTNGKQQINWMKLACDAAQINLLPFFEKAGMLRPIHAYIEDYGAGWNIITDDMINKLKDYVKEQGYPDYSEEINYINGHNYHIYRDDLELNVTKTQGQRNGDKVTIQHSVDGEALNAVAFETYNAQGNLIRITMYGLGSDDAHSYTQVLFPSSEDAAYIMAVGYNGTRKIVYSELAEDLLDIKLQLNDLIDETETLIDQCGIVTVDVNNKVKLQTTSSSSAYYVSTNAQSTQEGPISGLVDGKYGSQYTASQYYFHTDYSGNNSTDGLDHHITINLGEGNAVSKFKFQYWNRTNTDGNYIAELKIYGKKGNGDYTLITTLNDMPTRAGTTYESSVITCAEEYDYLRFMVTKNNNNNLKGGHPITHMAEFELTVIDYEVEFNETAGDASVDQVVAAYKRWEEAKAVYANATTIEQVQAAINNLTDAKEALNAAMQTNNKAALRELVARTTALINECATVTYRENEEIVPIVLQATNANGANYLSCSNLYNPNNVTHNNSSDGDIDYNCEQLLDGDITTYIHTDRTAATSTYPHYLQVTFGANVPEQFKFTYTTRSQGPNQVPMRMRVEGSNDGTNYEVLKSYAYNDSNNPLPRTAGMKWTDSEYLKGYAYLRFYVTASPAGNNPQWNISTTKPYFAMSEFGMELPPLPSGYVVTWNEGDHGNATDELVIAAYEARNVANSVLKSTATVEEIKAAEDALRECFYALNDAKNPVQYTTFTISSNVEGGGVLYGGSSYTEQLDALYTLTAEDLEAIYLEGYTSELSVNHETGSIRVTYTLKKSGWESLKREAEELIASCYVDGELKYTNSAYAGDIVDAQSAIDAAKERGDNATTLSEYNEAKEALEAAMSSLNTAIQNAEAEAEQREEARETLRNLIEQTEGLLAECATYGYGEHMVETPVGLQVDDSSAAYYLSTNADQNVVGNGRDGGGIAALIDGTVNTYMHTQWSGDAVVDDDHYIQVNLGNGMGLDEFTFTYATRKGSSASYNSPAPTIIELYGSVDGETFTDMIARFTASDVTNPLISYTELGEYWASNAIKPTQSYDYLRFYVKESDGPSSSATQYGGHYYFGMSEFVLKSVSYETNYYVESLTSYGNVTEEQFLNVARAMGAAKTLVDNSYDKTALEEAAENLQECYNTLLAAHNDYSYLPVTLTADMESPALYVMNSKRGTGKVLQYNAGDYDFTIVDATKVNEIVEANASQLFYFTKGTKKGQVYVHPFTAEGQVLAASEKTNGADKVFVTEMDNEYAMQWTFVNATIDGVVWYSLKGVDAPYFSHYGGGYNKMGFYGSEDDGSRFTFTEKTYHKVTIGKYLHTSLYLDYATTIPEGVKAYIATNPSAEGTIDLVKLQGDVLPANTGVILYSETPGTYYFLETNATATDNVNGNLLKGCASEQYVGDRFGGKKYYIFGQKNGEVGLYWARMDYMADGSHVGNDQGYCFKASANKVYLELDAMSEEAPSGFRFRIGEDETGIKGINTNGEAIIYDLYGRRIMEVVTPGLYIINGEKRYINIK